MDASTALSLAAFALAAGAGAHWVRAARRVAIAGAPVLLKFFRGHW